MTNRKKYKIIACFGNCILDYSPPNHSIINHLKKDFLNFKIYNFGIIGTIYEQMMIYNALAYMLKPEIVISFGIATDWVNGIYSCKKMIQDYKIVYTRKWETIDSKASQSSLIPSDNYTNSNEDINQAITYRIQQFNKIVKNNNGIFLSFCQIIFPHKNFLTTTEKILKAKELASSHPIYREFYNNRVFALSKLLNTSMKNKKYFYNLNKIIQNNRNTIFNKHFVYCNEYGSKITADFIAEKIKERIKDKKKKKNKK